MKFVTIVCDWCDRYETPEDMETPEHWLLLHDTDAGFTLHFCCEECRDKFVERREGIAGNSIRKLVQK